jgi:hypothetical protein
LSNTLQTPAAGVADPAVIAAETIRIAAASPRIDVLPLIC